MNNYLLALGWWNLTGCILMFGFFNESFGRKMLNEWTKIFTTEFTHNYWTRFWLAWAIGLNVFFALINILSVKWGYPDVKEFIAWVDVVAYTFFLGLCFWGIRAGRVASGIYSVIFIFLVWISWGWLVLLSTYGLISFQ